MSKYPRLANKLGDVLTLIVAGAMVSATLFVLRALWLLTMGGGFAGVSRDFIWMSPLGYLGLYTLAAIPVVLVARWSSRTRALTFAGFWFALWATFDLLLPVVEIHRVSMVVLSIGVGAAVGRYVGRASPAWFVRTRIVNATIAIALMVSAAAFKTWTVLGERRSQALIGTARTGAPNVLLLIWDTVRASELSVYGYRKPTTPNLQRVAEQGAVFDAAIATAPWTLPSHASIFTGRYPQRLNTSLREKLDASETTVAEIFRAAGYETVGIVGNLFYTSWESGLGRGFVWYHDYQRSWIQVLRSTLIGQSRFVTDLREAETKAEVKRALLPPRLFTLPKPARADAMRAADVTDAFLTWQRERAENGNRPFFAFLNYIDAHRPFNPPEPFRSRFANAKRRHPLEMYEAEIAYLDSELERLLGELARRGALENTLVIVTSDHGEHFGERGLQGHGNSVYAPAVRVPLVMRFTGRIPAGTRVANAVSLRDLGQTMLELADVRPPSAFPGTSLARYWTDAPDSGSVAVAQLGWTRLHDLSVPELDPMAVAIFDDEWQLVRAGSRGTEELFEYRHDPKNIRNLHGVDSAVSPEPLRLKLKLALQSDLEGKSTLRRKVPKTTTAATTTPTRGDPP